MMNYGWIRGLIEVSTPYRVKVPARMSRSDQTNLEISKSYWPIDLNRDSLDFDKDLVGRSTMILNQKVMEREWSFEEIDWILSELQLVLRLGQDSECLTDDLPIACSVSATYLDPPTSDRPITSTSKAPSPRFWNEILARGIDNRKSTCNPLSHSFIDMIYRVSSIDLSDDSARPKRPAASGGQDEQDGDVPYLMTNLIVFSTHEPCLLCSMALLHSRIKHLFFLFESHHSGGCGSVYNVHEQEGLNHKYFVWTLNPEFLLENREVDEDLEKVRREDDIQRLLCDPDLCFDP
ncbi:cytidine deaminase-like protein [Phakopsora pachyrhizi]|nr:cytidine deaminase-like protein [Phakopsora pachyrhizi]